MRSFSLFALALSAVALSACSDSGLTYEKLEAAKGMVNPMQDAAEAEGILKTELGDPATRTDTALTWYAPHGDACAALEVGLMGEVVGGVEVKEGQACP